MNKGMLRAAALSAVAIVAGLAAPASAHRQWMMPSATVLSGENVWVTVDAAVSNDLFYFEHVPMRLDGITATAPDGAEVEIQNGATGRYRSTFDVQLAQRGTYRIGSATSGIAGSFKVNGEEQRLPRGTRADAIAAAIPADATDIRLTEMASRNEIFVTAGAPTDGVFRPTGRGIEIAPVTHPNDLVAGETARFRFLVDGRPAPDLAVTVVPGGIRYRDSLGQMDLRTGADGTVAIPWNEPGMYWVNVTAEDTNTSVPGATARRLSYVTVVEVLAP